MFNIENSVSAPLNIRNRAFIIYNIASLTLKDAKLNNLIKDSILSVILILL
jgi:hypothetical protein